MNDTAVSSFISGFFSRLSERGIRCCILRGYEGLPETHGRDIDVFIENGDRSVLRGMIRELGWDCIEKCSFDGFFTLACFYMGGESAASLQMDFWTSLNWRGIPWCSGEELLDGIRLHNGFPVPAKGAEAVMIRISEERKVLQ